MYGGFLWWVLRGDRHLHSHLRLTTQPDSACHPVRLIGELAPHFELRAPDEAVDPDEASLAEGAAAAHTRSTEVVSSLLPGVDLGLLTAADDGGEIVAASPGPAVLHTLVGDDLLDDLLTHHEQRPTRLSAYRDGAAQPFEHFVQPRGHWSGAALRVGVGRLVAEVSGGVTVALDGTDEIHPALDSLAEHIERLFVGYVLVNAYVSAGDRSATGRHWDDHDVLVLQLSGTKHWRVQRPLEPVPLRSFVADDSPGGEVAWEGELTPGDCLYLPRGHPHEVTPTGGYSAHLTFGITRQRVMDLLTSLVARAGRSPTFRRDLTRSPGSGWDEKLARDIAGLAKPASVAAFRAMVPALLSSRATTRFAAMAGALFDGEWDGLTARLALPGGLSVVEAGAVTVGADEIVLAGARRHWAVARHALPAIGRMLQGVPVPIEDLATACPRGGDCSRRMVAQLAVDGIASLDRGTGPGTLRR